MFFFLYEILHKLPSSRSNLRVGPLWYSGSDEGNSLVVTSEIRHLHPEAAPEQEAVEAHALGRRCCEDGLGVLVLVKAQECHSVYLVFDHPRCGKLALLKEAQNLIHIPLFHSL